jgi:hypothetical protein
VLRRVNGQTPSIHSSFDCRDGTPRCGIVGVFVKAKKRWKASHFEQIQRWRLTASLRGIAVAMIHSGGVPVTMSLSFTAVGA